MTSITKPKVQHPSSTRNALGLSRRDYEGGMSTLCAGCGHDSVTAALIDAFWQLDILKRRGAHLDYMRVRSFPFGQEVEEFLASHSVLFVVEQNRDAQLKGLLTLETKVEKAKLRSILHYSGLPISSSVIVDGVLAELGESLSPQRTAIR